MDYPAPKIPLSPVLSGHGLQWTGNSSSTCSPSILANCYLLHVTSGRAAIALALEHDGIKAGDEVLIPAYHCESMVSPTLWRKAKPVFYKINMDTSVDIEDLKNKITANTKAIIVTHYFGFIQDMPPLVKLCEQRNLILIEDCAHSFFGQKDGKHAGAWGDYAIASSMKFFPIFDGGLISSSKRDIKSVKLETPSIFFQTKSAINVIQAAIRYNRLGVAGVLLKHLTNVAEGAWHFVKKITGRGRAGIHGPSSSGGGYGLDENWIHTRASYFSKFVIKHQSQKRITRERKKNYQKLHEALHTLPRSRPLFDHLPEGIVPLVFPLYVENPEQYFDSLKQAGVPIWRFGEFLDEAVTDELCPESVDLSAHVFQFPCHQELTDSEIDWMIKQITNLFNAQSSRV